MNPQPWPLIILHSQSDLSVTVSHTALWVCSPAAVSELGKWYNSLVTSIKESESLSPSIRVIYLIRVAMVHVAMAGSEGFVIADSPWDMNSYRTQLIKQIVKRIYHCQTTHSPSPSLFFYNIDVVDQQEIRHCHLINFIQFLNMKTWIIPRDYISYDRNVFWYVSNNPF